MRKVLLIIFLLLCLSAIVQAQQQKIYLPVIFNKMPTLPDPILRLRSSNGIIVDLLGIDSGWKLADPNWNPRISRIKRGGAKVNSALAPGRRLTNHEYDNVVETIPLSLRGIDQDKAMQTANEMLELLDQASNYWDRPYELDPVWLEAKLPCNDCFTAYSRVIIGSIPELTNPFGQPFFSSINSEAIMEDITLIIEREPFWRPVEPDTIVGPLYNLIDNPDFELWNFGVADSQPDSWTNLESLHITGTNNRQDTAVKFGKNALRINVSGSTLAGASKGITQVINDTQNNTKYTILAWVRSEGVSNGVGRILITYASQLELYRESSSHGWTLYTGKITTGVSDIVAISVEILTTAANADGTFYIDGLMFVEGDWEQEAIDNVLPWLSGSHIVNHWDQPINNPITAGDINYVDAWNVPGDISSLIRLEFQNNTLPADLETPIEIYRKVRIGMRRTQNIFLFDNFSDPVGEIDTTASSDDRLSFIINQGQVGITTKVIHSSSIINHNQGRFRVLARIFDTRADIPNLAARLRYFVGSASINNKILESVNAAIRGDWTIVDLTKNIAMNQDLKFKTAPGQMGYTVEFSRPTGSDIAYLDYVIVMPTDGGFIDAQLSVPILFRDILSVDNTVGALSVEGIDTPDGFTEIVDTGGAQRGGVVFKGDMYFYSDNSGLSNVISRIRDRKKEDVFDFNDGTNGQKMAVYNGQLFINADLDIYSNDGEQLPGTLEFTLTAQVAGGSVGAMIAFNGKLFVGQLGSPARIYEWDGTTLTESFNGGAGTNTISSFAVYGNRLYAANALQRIIYQYNVDSGSWTQNTTLGAVGEVVEQLQPFQGKLYAGLNPGVANDPATIYSYDGATWTLVGTLAELQVPQAMATFADEIFLIGGTATGGVAENVYQTTDGETFDIVYDAGKLEIFNLVEFEGGIYIINGETGAATLFAIFFDINSFTISDFSGTQFLAPPRTRTDERRHRYFFSYDRENSINNINDKALIGIGFVPQYLTIRGKN